MNKTILVLILGMMAGSVAQADVAVKLHTNESTGRYEVMQGDRVIGVAAIDESKVVEQNIDSSNGGCEPNPTPRPSRTIGHP